MNTIGWHYTKGSTELVQFWGDMHIATVRADKLVNDREDLIDVLTRYNEDETQFDRTTYNCGPKFEKANREYYTYIEARKTFMELVFEYNGKTYRTRTSRITKAWEIEKKADKVISFEDIQMDCLIRDDNDEVISVIKEYGRTSHYLEY